MRNSTKFYSKRNTVVLDSEQDAVTKRFVEKNDYLKEKRIYGILEKSNFNSIPKLIKADDDNNTLYLEYLNGIVLLDALTEMENKQDLQGATFLLENALRWLDEFYRILSYNIESKEQGFGMVLGDVNLRNFIVCHQDVFGLDFETCCNRFYDEEKAELLARYLLYDPMETQFKNAVIDEVLKKYYNGAIGEIERMIDSVGYQKLLVISKRKSKYKNS